MNEDFVVSHVSRDDIVMHFGKQYKKKAMKLTDEQMVFIAYVMMDKITEMNFWEALQCAVEKMEERGIITGFVSKR